MLLSTLLLTLAAAATKPMPLFRPLLSPARALPLVMQYGGGGDVKPGDWTCEECGANVFARRQKCFRCGAPRGDGWQIHPGGRGGDRYDDQWDGGGYDRGNDVRPGDWTCGQCGANVFARKRECFRCGALKPDGDGGGYVGTLPDRGGYDRGGDDREGEGGRDARRK